MEKDLVLTIRFGEGEVRSAVRNVLGREPTSDEEEEMRADWDTCYVNLKVRYRLLETIIKELCGKKNSEEGGGVKK